MYEKFVITHAGHQRTLVIQELCFWQKLAYEKSPWLLITAHSRLFKRAEGKCTNEEQKTTPKL